MFLLPASSARLESPIPKFLARSITKASVFRRRTLMAQVEWALEQALKVVPNVIARCFPLA